MKMPMMKQQTFATLLASVCLFSLIVVGLNAASNDGRLSSRRFKRQTAIATVQRPQAGGASDQDAATLPDMNSVGQMGSASASASVMSTDKGQPGGAESAGSIGNKRRKKPKPMADELDADSFEGDENEEERPRRVRKPSRRRPSKQPASSLDELEEDENCHEIDDYDYRDFHPDSFHEAAARPMRHFSRMMEGMFNQMRGLSAGAGGNSAVASASSGGDNYSRASSVITRNGRTRGVVTETKDGRTRTRRIDSGDDEEDED